MSNVKSGSRIFVEVLCPVSALQMAERWYTGTPECLFRMALNRPTHSVNYHFSREKSERAFRALEKQRLNVHGRRITLVY